MHSLLILIATTIISSSEPSIEHSDFSSVGFYPLWENTGRVLGHRHILVGTNFVEMGIMDRFQVGIRPQEFLFRTLNLNAKWNVRSRGDYDLSVNAEFLALLPGATSVFTSSNFVSRIDNTRSELWVVPIGSSFTWYAADFTTLHTTATIMGVGGSQQRFYASLGLFTFLELKAVKNHALLLHLGEVGFWNHDFFLIGASYRLNIKWFEAQVGYFYRLTKDGRQATPQLSLGVSL